MARTLVIGLTESGTRTTVNEDTFSLGGRVYPDMITGSEEESGKSAGYNQLFVVTQGVGGPGAGDLAGRIIQRTASDLVDLLGRYKNPDLNFDRFSRDLIKEAQIRVGSQVVPRNAVHPGASMALLLIDANVAHVLNIGETDIFLFRAGEIFLMSRQAEEDGQAPVLISSGQPLPPPQAYTTRHFGLQPGDLIILTSKGFRKGYSPRDFVEDLMSPDAFAASIRQAQIHSRSSDDSDSGTILAVKVRDLELSEPVEDSAASDMRRSIYHNGQPEAPIEAPAPARRKKQAPPADDRKTEIKKALRKRKIKTFFLFLLLGFLVGMAVILLVWFLILR